MPYENLAGRTAVVTGAASGIGEAVAVLLAARGARVALLARREERLAALAGKIRADGGQALPVVADVTDETSWPTPSTGSTRSTGRSTWS